jgi:transcriptional regulator with XRE-family HTH domain
MWTMDKGRTGASPARRNVAINMRAIRKERGMSLRALSTRMGELGRSLAPDTLSRIERAAFGGPKQLRRVDVDDLVALALALGVTPSRLLLPGPQTISTPPRVQLTTVVNAPPRAIWRWANGISPLPPSSYGDMLPADHPMGDWRAIAEWQRYNCPHQPPRISAVDHLLSLRDQLRPVLNEARRAASEKDIPISQTAEYLQRYSEVTEH